MLKSKLNKRKCKCCGETFMQQKPLQYVCSPECFYNYGMKALEAKRKKDSDDELKQMKLNTEKKPDFEKKLQSKINEIIRLIDKDFACIATKKLDDIMQAGHYLSVGSSPTVRFHLHNIHIQSVHSNMHKAGDTIRYRRGIIRVYGQEYMDYMDSLHQHPPINLTIDDLKDKINIANCIIKELKLVNKTYNKDERIDLRAEYNYRLGIYSPIMKN